MLVYNAMQEGQVEKKGEGKEHTQKKAPLPQPGFLQRRGQYRMHVINGISSTLCVITNLGVLFTMQQQHKKQKN